MDQLFEISVKKFFLKRKDLFGENGKFLKFNIVKSNTAPVGDNSTVIFGQLEYEENGKKKSSDTLCVKLMPVMVNFKSCNISCFMNEIYFYAKILPFFESVNVKTNLFAKFYDGCVEINEKGENAIMIFEDLTRAGFVNSKRLIFLDYVHLALMMRKLGEFHALSYKARHANPNTFFSLATCFAPAILSLFNDSLSMFNKSAKLVLQELKNDPKYSAELSLVEKICENACMYTMMSMKKFWNRSTSVISHLSYRAANVLFRYENDIPVDLKILDLAFCQLTSPAVDIIFLLYYSANQRMRNDRWNDLIDEYYKGLSVDCSVTVIPTKDWIKGELCSLSHMCLFHSVAYLPFQIKKEEDLKNNKYKSEEMSSKCDVKLDLSETMVDVSDKILGVVGLSEMTDVFKDAIDRGFFRSYEQILE